MPPFETTEHSPTRKHRRLTRAVLTFAAMALFGLAASASPAGAQMYSTTATKTAKTALQPVRLSVFSPGVGDTAGQDGAGFVVDLSLTARNQAANSLLAPEAGYKPFFNNPTAPTFKPGADSGAPGLVVTLSTTPTVAGTPFQGPNTNLAGLFQTNGVGTVKHGRTQTWNTWQIGKAGFGSGPSTLTVFVVKGTAPALVPATGLDIISNTVKVPFTITTPAAATSSPPAAAAPPTVMVTHDAKLGDILVDTTGRTVYTFEKDQGTMTACTGACVNAWPALPANGAPTVGAGLDASKVASASGQVTYNGHLLYHYSGDGNPGDTVGAGIPSWDAVSPAGTPVHAN
jgi:predicted lipoprotein with Yx(FWY)xxD motif